MCNLVGVYVSGIILWIIYLLFINEYYVQKVIILKLVHKLLFLSSSILK